MTRQAEFTSHLIKTGKSMALLFQNISGYLGRFYDKHDYLAAFLMAAVISGFVIFYRATTVYLQDSIPDIFEFTEVNLADLSKETSASGAELDPNQVIASIEANAVDLAFMTGVDAPRLISRLKKKFPREARKLEVEAVVLTEVLINTDGSVVKVGVIGVKLNKNLPEELKKRLQRAFLNASIQMMSQARFSEPMIQGKNVPVKLEIPLDFQLTD